AQLLVGGAEHVAQRPDADRVLDDVALRHAVADAIRSAGEQCGRELAANAGGARHASRPHLALTARTAAFGRVWNVAAAAVAEQSARAPRNRDVERGPGVYQPTLRLRSARRQRPVLPKPPSPRTVVGSVSTSSSSARTTGATTSCAMRSPRRRVNG